MTVSAEFSGTNSTPQSAFTPGLSFALEGTYRDPKTEDPINSRLKKKRNRDELSSQKPKEKDAMREFTNDRSIQYKSFHGIYIKRNLFRKASPVELAVGGKA